MRPWQCVWIVKKARSGGMSYWKNLILSLPFTIVVPPVYSPKIVSDRHKLIMVSSPFWRKMAKSVGGSWKTTRIKVCSIVALSILGPLWLLIPLPTLQLARCISKGPKNRENYWNPSLPVSKYSWIWFLSNFLPICMFKIMVLANSLLYNLSEHNIKVSF